ncbi:MAG: hypothetical protein COA69_07505 [Robiginitomaculum sp.]|nr:MAG: hypothetical protein COA69_07505 [Robiginitomaculum sp.]
MASFYQKYLLPGLVFQGVVIGGGYATGRELVEFFIPHGPVGGLLAMGVAAFVWSLVMAVSFELCRMSQSYEYKSFFKQLLGPLWFIFEILLLILMIIVLAIIGAASGEIIKNLVHVPLPVGTIGLLAGIGVLTFYGSKMIEHFIGAWSICLYLSYFVLVVVCLILFSGDIQSSFAQDSIKSGWAFDGLRYAGYNLAPVPAVFFCLHHITERKEAITAGLLAGVIAMIPAVFLFIAMLSQYPQIGNAPIPSTALLSHIGSPVFSVVFQIILLGTLLQTGVGLLHAVNERVAATMMNREQTMPKWARPVLATGLLCVALFLASKFGIIDLIAKGYGWLTFGFIAVYVIPVLSIGVYKIWRARPSLLLLPIFFITGFNPPYADAQIYDVPSHYDKTEHMVSMRDGTKLFTAIYTPKDRSQIYPILLYRTPYSVKGYGKNFSPNARMAPSLAFMKQGYIFVLQELRGTYKSEGDFEVLRPIRTDKSDPRAFDESTDNYDTIEWALNHITNHNGKVGQWGTSYAGWTTIMGMIDPHPALSASAPQAPPSDMFIGDDWHHNGAFRLMYSFSWMGNEARKRGALTEEDNPPFDYGTPWGYEFFLQAGATSKLNDKYFGGTMIAWDDLIDHPNYDEFWKKQAVLPYMKNINVPTLNVAGWFDAEDFYGPISIYKEIEATTPNNKSTLVVGPWRHSGWGKGDGSSLGDIQFGSRTAEYYTKHIVLPFFEHHLKGKNDWKGDEAIVFETGHNRWHHMREWPPKSAIPKNLYFHANGKLSFNPPTKTNRKSADTYINDPTKPVPFSAQIITKMGHIWMVEDQRPNATRPDVLTYSTEILSEDITIGGSILANLFISTSGTDADYFVKLIDVYPGDDPKMGSYQMLLGYEVMRAKYRDSMEHPTPLRPNKVTPISFNIWDKFHTFKKGHRIMVQIHSSWFPAYDRNPQKFMNIYKAEGDDYKSASHKIYRSSKFSSHLVLPVLPSSGLPYSGLKGGTP